MTVSGGFCTQGARGEIRGNVGVICFDLGWWWVGGVGGLKSTHGAKTRLVNVIIPHEWMSPQCLPTSHYCTRRLRHEACHWISGNPDPTDIDHALEKKKKVKDYEGRHLLDSVLSLNSSAVNVDSH